MNVNFLEAKMAKKGDWVQIHNIVLTPEQRAAGVPDDTKKCPLEMWVKGRLQQDAKLGDEVTVITRTGRTATGKLVDEAPHFEHSFGGLVPEILDIGDTVRAITFGGDNK